jgi:hypothetical protein
MNTSELDRIRSADRRPPRGWRLPRAVLVALMLVLGAGLAACSGAGGSPPGSATDVEEDDRDEVVVDATSSGLEPVVMQEVPDAGPAPAGFPMEGAKQTGTAPDGPCPGVVADGLVLTPNRVRLLGGQTKGAVDVRNCADGDVAWTATSKPWVTLPKEQGTVPSGATYRVLFTVNTSSLPTGPYTFNIDFSWSGNSSSVPVEGTKLGGLVAPGGPTSPPPTIGGLIAPGPSGCAVKCIVKAWMTPTVGADVTLDMRTNVSARMWARVDTEPPQMKAGKPHFSSPDVNLASGTDYRRQWNPRLGPLRPDTSYHIVVVAEDLNRNVSYQVGTFRTRNVATGLANSEPGGCSANCVKSAVLRRIVDSPNLDIDVTTHVPARMQVFANGVTVASTGGKFSSQWSATLELSPGQNYEIKLKVTDQQGHVQQHTALVSTPKPAAGAGPDLVVRFHEIFVNDDADDSGANIRGELRFRFEVDGQRVPHLDVGERKVRSPERLDLGARSVGVSSAPDQLRIRVQGLERDNNQPGFCPAGTGLFPDTSGRTTIDGCYEMEWNTAEIVIDVKEMQQPPAFPACQGFDIQADLCLAYASTGDDDPRFSVVLSVEIVG